MIEAIKKILPAAGVEGGEIQIACEGFDSTDYSKCSICFGDETGRIIGASPDKVVAQIPEGSGGCDYLELIGGEFSKQAGFILGRRIASELHPVANPAIDPESGSVYVTRSGTRGQKVPVSVYQIDSRDNVSPYLSDVVNPTGLAFDREGFLHITSRYDGTLLRVNQFKEVEVVSEDLGVATGVAFDTRGVAYVGDRGGTIFRVNEIGESRPFASIEPSVSAFHLAFSPDGDLYVSGPTVSTFDSIMRVNALGTVSRFFTGLGRPQGLAFDVDGNLYVAASLRGQRGIIRISPDGVKAEVVVAGANLIGLAFSPKGEMLIVSTQKVFRLPLGIRGYSVFK